MFALTSICTGNKCSQGVMGGIELILAITAIAVCALMLKDNTFTVANKAGFFTRLSCKIIIIISSSLLAVDIFALFFKVAMPCFRGSGTKA
ncbi:MAG: hypothetical protein ACKVOH_05590 [Chlamydiales bacterium]